MCSNYIITAIIAHLPMVVFLTPSFICNVS